MSDPSNFSRRHFLKATGALAGAATLGGAVFSTAAEVAQEPKAPAEAAHKTGEAGAAFRGRMFFTTDREFSTLSEAAERIFPKDETGPGAIELGVPYFIDNQLAGAYGYNAREYTAGPFSPGAPTQGYQTPLPRKDVFLQGIAALNDQAESQFKKPFSQLDAGQKDQILKMCEAGELPTEGFSSAFFFSLLKTAVLAGVYADPIYSGNDAMQGWKMKDYPGARMANIDVIENAGFDSIAPVSLAGMH